MIDVVLVFFKNFHTVFHNCCIHMHFSHNSARVIFSPHVHLSSPGFLIKANLPMVRWSVLLVLIYILIISGVDHFFFHVSAGLLYVFFCEKCLYLLAILFNHCFLLRWYWRTYAFWILTPCHMNSCKSSLHRIFSSFSWLSSWLYKGLYRGCLSLWFLLVFYFRFLGGLV